MTLYDFLNTLDAGEAAPTITIFNGKSGTSLSIGESFDFAEMLSPAILNAQIKRIYFENCGASFSMRIEYQL